MSIQFFSRSAHTEALKRDVQNLAQDAVQAAQKHVVEPATSAVRGAVNTASDAALDAVSSARKYVNTQANRAEKAAAEQWDRASSWITSNPFASVGIAFAAGMVFSTISRSRR